MPANHHLFETAAGFAAIGWGERGIVSFRLPASTLREAEGALLRRLPASRQSDPDVSVAAVVEAARRYFRGDKVDFSTVAIDLGPQDEFFARVYALVRGLGWGETTSYGEVARALGAEPMAARLVGEAMARNPVPLIVPCHRVLAAGGRRQDWGFFGTGWINVESAYAQAGRCAARPAPVRCRADRLCVLGSGLLCSAATFSSPHALG
jgi:methylated-DNA-[protein]-cysteine S-methyltransferase